MEAKRKQAATLRESYKKSNRLLVKAAGKRRHAKGGMAESAPAGWKTITHTTKIISGEFEGDLTHVEKVINIKQMLQLVCRLLALQEAAALEQSLRLWSKDMISCSGSFCPKLISEHLCAPVSFTKSKEHDRDRANGKKSRQQPCSGAQGRTLMGSSVRGQWLNWFAGHAAQQSRFYSRSANRNLLHSTGHRGRKPSPQVTDSDKWQTLCIING